MSARVPYEMWFFILGVLWGVLFAAIGLVLGVVTA